MSARALPAGYERIQVGRAEAVAVPGLIPLLEQVLAAGTVYDFARLRPDVREFTGRQPAYAVFTPMGDGMMVVRHNRHGGLLAGVTGDRFLYPTRAPMELALSLRLTAAGVPTPPILAYAVYRTGAFARSDVVTRMVVPGLDLAAALAQADAAWRAKCLDLSATLVAELSRAGARHHDLNAKNILLGSASPLPSGSGYHPGGDPSFAILTPSEGDPVRAVVLDVDRVQFGWKPEDALAHNLARLDRSLRKRRERLGEMVTDDEIAEMARAAAGRM